MQKPNNLKEGVLTIIIVTYNNETTIKGCLDSVFKNKTSNFRKRIIIVDNDSKDKTPQILKKLKGDKLVSQIILNNFNDGFGRTVSNVIEREKSDSDFFFVLNPDTTIEPDSLENLLERADSDTNLGLLSCKIVDPETKKVLFEKGSIDFIRFQTTHSAPRTFQLQYVTGCALLIKNSVIEKIGAFDPNFFLYYEDADFSKRALDAGFKIDTENSAICYHMESHSSTSETKDYFLVRNGLYFFHKHYLFFALPYFWAMFFVRFVYHRFFSKKDVVTRAMADFWKN